MTPHIALRINATFSLLSGLVLTALPGAIGGALEVEIDGWLRLLGLGLLGHAAFALWASGRDDITTWIKLNLVLIAPYPLLMITLAVTVIDSALGRGLVLADGAIVGMCALGQWPGVRNVPVARHAHAG